MATIINLFSFLKRHFIPLLIMAGISFPFIAFVIKVWEADFPEAGIFADVFSRTLWQSLLSLILSWVIAVPAGLGLLFYFKRPFYFFLEWIFLLPFLLPFIVIIGGVMNSLEGFTRFPFGLFPVVLCHSLIYGPAMAVLLARLIMSKCSGFCDWAEVHGIPKIQLIKTLLWFVLRKDIQLISLAVFCFCFTSFSIPLLVGGGKWKTMEVFIYEYLKIPDLQPQALGLILFEILFIFALSFFISKPMASLKNLKSIPYLKFKPAVFLGCLPCLFIFSGLMAGFFHLGEIVQLEVFFPALGATLGLSLGVGFGVLLFLMLVGFYPFTGYLDRFLIGYIAPSVVLTGFSLLIFLGGLVYVSWIFGLVILFFPALYRWAGEAFLKSLKNQILTAQTLGAGSWMIFRKITLPQCFHGFCLLSGVAGFWASGDFALTLMTSQGESNLAILAQQLLGQYRIEQGLAVILFLLIAGSLCFLFFSSMPFAFNYFLKKAQRNK